jgi:acyl-CoA synthetase (AMP-forming)/AMP-acid ligase II
MNDTYSEHLKSALDAEHIEHARSIEGRPRSDKMLPFKNFAHLLEHRVVQYEEKTWLKFIPDNGQVIEYSYLKFSEAVYKTAHILHKQGVGRGDRICTVGSNHSDTVVQYFAAWCIGAVVVPINIGEDDARIAYIIANSHAKLLFVRSPFVSRIADVLSTIDGTAEIIEAGNTAPGKFKSYDAEMSTTDAGFRPTEQADLDDDALIVYTSGTTGNPKGVVLDQYNLLVDAHGIAEWHGMTPAQRMMCVLPIHHVNGTVVTIITPLYYGGSLILNEKFHTRTFFSRIVEHKVHVVSVVPTLLQFLLHDKVNPKEYDLSQFRHIICGAGPLTCDLAKQFESTFNIPIMHGYGLSETTCYSCFLPVDLTKEEHAHWMQVFGFPSIGVPIPENEMEIHSPEGEKVFEGDKGEIVIRGHNVMKYYYKNPEANESTFANGWFRSGDEGFYRMDAKGRKFFFITGRLKELIIRGGVNLAPLEIDEVINTCPGVKTGIAVGFENDWYGEEVGALVHKSNPALSEQDVIEHCKKELPFSKCPKAVVFSEDIPVTSTGKYQRNKVKHLFAEWKSQQFKK